MLAAFGSAVLVLVVGLVSLFAVRHFQQATEAVVHTDRVVRRLDLLLSHLKDAETGQRGYLLTDARRLRQILFNLLSNAVKFGAGKPVEVFCAAAPGDGLALRVHDHGAGIAPEDQARIFEEFVQLPTASGGEGGTGLGLAISRQLAAALGGSLTVRSAPGKGSTFVLDLRLEYTTAPAEPAN